MAERLPVAGEFVDRIRARAEEIRSRARARAEEIRSRIREIAGRRGGGGQVLPLVEDVRRRVRERVEEIQRRRPLLRGVVPGGPAKGRVVVKGAAIEAPEKIPPKPRRMASIAV